jgi:hypothetical protein
MSAPRGNNNNRLSYGSKFGLSVKQGSAQPSEAFRQLLRRLFDGVEIIFRDNK